ncbi:MAG: carbohydrate-binding domain-containing protein [Dehalococcoidia bacterium]|jgi:hypothetical protein
MQKFLLATLALSSIAVASACGSSGNSPAPGSTASTTSPQTSQASASGTSSASTATSGASAVTAATHEAAGDYTWDESSVVDVKLTGNSATASGSGVNISGSTVTITAEGTYRISGTLTDGQLAVDTGDDGIVRLLFNGVDITNADNAAVSVVKAEEVVIMLAANTTNRLSDGKTYRWAEADADEPNAALFSKADLSIAGEGTLVVTGNFNDGIASKDGLVIAGGNIQVTAADDGIRGKDYLVVKGGTVKVTAGGDGLKSDEADDTSLGYVSVSAGKVDIVSGGDGIDAESVAEVLGGTLSLTTGGGAGAKVATDASAKAIKGGALASISGGVTSINAADDAIHSNVAVKISGGEVTVATGDDAVHGDTTAAISGGKLTVTRSYEGIESAAITISNGEISIVSSDDALNAAGGVDGSGAQQPGGGAPRDQFTTGGNYSITISGGTIVLDSTGDGVDANGSVTMSGGTVIVNGPTANNNGAIDYDGTFTMTGGTIVAAGSAGMAQAPGTGGLASVSIRFAAAQKAGTLVSIRDAEGKTLLTFAPTKAFQSLVFADSALARGATYSVFIGGTASGADAAGVYDASSFTPAGAATMTVVAK